MSKETANGNYFGVGSVFTLATGLFVGMEIDLHATWKVIAAIVSGVVMAFCWYQYKKTK